MDGIDSVFHPARYERDSDQRAVDSDSPDRAGPRPDSNPKTYSALLAMLPPLPAGAEILDVPCGSGALTWLLLKQGYRVTPCDVHPGKFALHEPRCRTVNLNQGLPFADGFFDAAFFCEGPQVLENTAGALREFWRVLKPGGSLLIALPNTTSLYSRLRFLFTGFFSGFIRPYNELTGEGNFHPMTLPELRFLLHRSGFRIEAVATNRYKWSGLLLILLAPAIWIATGAMVLQKSRGGMRKGGLELWRQLTSFPLLFGRSLLVRATRMEALSRGES